jgi:hypothetical protein
MRCHRLHLRWIPLAAIVIGAASLAAQEQGRAGAGAAAMEERFRKADRDGDGRLSPQEMPMPELFRQWDQDGDGFVTLDEVRGFYAAKAEGRQQPPAASAAPAGAKTTTESEWRVTGFIRQGQHQEASLERKGLMPRFVREGDRLPGDLMVLEVNYDARSVTLGNGKETIIVRGENYMAPPPAPPKTATAQPPQGQSGGWKNRWGGAGGQSGMQGGANRWSIPLPNGQSFDMKSYVARYGGVNATMEHVRGLMERETDPERLRYRQAQMSILRAMSRAGAQ